MTPKTDTKQYEHIKYPKINGIKFFISNVMYIPPHLHNEFELILIMKGDVQIITLQEKIDLHAGDIALFNPFEAHTMESTIDWCTMLVIQASPDIFLNFFPAFKNIRFQALCISSILSKEKYRTVFSSCLDLGYSYVSEDFGYELKCMNCLCRIFLPILADVPLRTVKDTEIMLQANQQSRVGRMINYIRDHYIEKITLSEIAENEGLSLTYVSHMFKKQMHMTFQQYLNNIRLEKALYLLNNTSMSILDISLASGFSNIKYLNRHFIRKYHIKPREYQKNHRKTIKNQRGFIATSQYQYEYSPKEELEMLDKYRDGQNV